MTAAAHDPIKPPSKFLLLAEGRALWEAGAAMALWPLLQLTPRGDGHAVLVLPGLVASDISTKLLRRYLQGRGYDAHGWGLGRNLGPRQGIEAGMLQRLESLHAETGRKVSLVGWSLGGVYARLLAASRPELVRSVITLGSPFTGSARATNAWRVYEGVSGQSSEDPRRMRHVEPTPSVPTTSIFSRSDGVVAWQACQDPLQTPHSENVEVEGSHVGLVWHPKVWRVIADRLSQPEGHWQPYREARVAAANEPDAPRTPRLAA